jgi:hypothetical protein
MIRAPLVKHEYNARFLSCMLALLLKVTSMDLSISREVIRIVESVPGLAVKLPNMGATIPLAAIERTAHAQREYSDPEFVGWDRAYGSADDNVVVNSG